MKYAFGQFRLPVVGCSRALLRAGQKTARALFYHGWEFPACQDGSVSVRRAWRPVKDLSHAGHKKATLHRREFDQAAQVKL